MAVPWSGTWPRTRGWRRRTRPSRYRSNRHGCPWTGPGPPRGCAGRRSGWCTGTALIGMSDGTPGLAAEDRHLESFDHQLGVEGGAHGPADNAAREDVEDDGQVEPAFPGPDEGDVADVLLIRPGRREVTVHQIGRHGQGGVALGGLSIAASVRAFDSQLVHQAAHPLARAAHVVVVSELVPDSRHSVIAARAGVNGGDERAQSRVFFLTRAFRPGPPGVVAARGDTEQPAHSPHVVVRLLSLHDPEDLYRVFRVSAAKKAAAFFRMTLSSSRSRTRRRRRTSSWRSSVVRPFLRRPLSRSACATQWRSDSAETPRSLAATLTWRPPSRTKRTASARNSGGYSGVNFWGIVGLLVGLLVPSVKVST